jgi:hypothetical protein
VIGRGLSLVRDCPSCSLKVYCDALLLPVAVARRVEPFLFTCGRLLSLDGLWLGNRWRGTEMVRGLRVLRAFHEPKMIMRTGNAKY